MSEFYHVALPATDAELTLPCRHGRVSIQRMQRTCGVIRAHTISPGGKPALRLEVDPVSIPAPGQPMLAYLPGSNAALRTPLYASRIHTDGFTSVTIPSPAWHVGAELDLLGPIGHGFSPPQTSKRWVILAIELSIDSLLPLVDTALERDIALTVYSDSQLPDLPAQVEIAATTENLMEWADYTAMILPHSRLHQIPTTLGLEAELPPAAQVEILTDLALPCGLGVCSACSFHTRGGWKLACEHGPVYQAKGWLW